MSRRDPGAPPLHLPVMTEDCERALSHAIDVLARDPKMKKAVAELRAPKPEDKLAAFGKLGEQRSEGRYECVMNAQTTAELRRCDWF